MYNQECLFCKKSFPLDIFSPFCPLCGEPLLFPPFIPERKESSDSFPSIKNRLPWLPLTSYDPSLSLGEGGSPLVRCTSLMAHFNLPPLFAKNESFNPTASFKDRGTAVAVQAAVSLGVKKIGTVSTGNMAASTAAYGAKARLKTYLMLKEDTSDLKIASAAVFGPVLIKVRGDYGHVFSESFALGKKHGIYFMNSVDPFRIEGYKMTGYEIFHQLDYRPPDFIFVPLSSGGHLIGLMRAYQNLKQQGRLDKSPAFVGVQADGCSPLVLAFETGKPRFQRIPRGRTAAQSISNPDPPGGNIVLKLIRENEGLLVSVSDGDILKAQKLLAEKEGIFCLPASAASLAGFLKLRTSGRIKKNHVSVMVITGSGLKSPPLTEKPQAHHLSSGLEGFEDIMNNAG